MAYPPETFLALDVVSALLTLALVAFFAAAWRRTGSMLHALLAAGFLFVGLGYLAVSVSQFELTEDPDRWYALRLAGRTGGALVLAFAYLGAHRHGSPRPWLTLSAAAAAGAVVLAVLYWGVPPARSLPAPGQALFASHLVQLAAYSVCVASSSSGYRRAPRGDRALVPGAFLAWALSSYTWVLIDLSGAIELLPFAYGWRLLALVLLLLALALPARPTEGADAEA